MWSVYTVRLRKGGRIYLQMLLGYIKDVSSFAEIRKANDFQHWSFRHLCKVWGFLTCDWKRIALLSDELTSSPVQPNHVCLTLFGKFWIEKLSRYVERAFWQVHFRIWQPALVGKGNKLVVIRMPRHMHFRKPGTIFLTCSRLHFTCLDYHALVETSSLAN